MSGQTHILKTISRTALLVVLSSPCWAADSLRDTYFKSGMDAVAQGRLSDGERLLSLGWKESQDSGKKDRLSVLILNKLSEAQRKLGKLADAETTESKAIEIAENDSETQHSLGMIYANMGTTKQEAKKPDEAEKYFRKALDKNEAEFGSNSPEVGIVLRRLASLYKDEGKLIEADALTKQADTIFSAGRSAGPISPYAMPRAQAEMNEGLKALELNDFDSAIAKLTTATQTDPTFKPAIQNLAIAYQHRGLAKLKKQSVDDAMHDLEMSAQLMEHGFSDHDPRLAQVQENLAQVYTEKHLNDKADAAYGKAVGIYRTACGSTSVRYTDCLQRYASYLRKQGRLEMAEAASDEANKGKQAKQSNELLTYKWTVRSMIQSEWEKLRSLDRSAGIRPSSYSQFNVSVGTDGKIKTISLLRSCGSKTFDDEARTAITSTVPLPKPPGSSIDLSVAIYPEKGVIGGWSPTKHQTESFRRNEPPTVK